MENWDIYHCHMKATVEKISDHSFYLVTLFLPCFVKLNSLLVNSVICEDYFRWGRERHCSTWFTSPSPSQGPFECYILTCTIYLCFHLADILFKKKVCFNKQKLYFSEWNTIKNHFSCVCAYRKENPGQGYTSIFYFSLSIPRGLSWAPWQTVDSQTSAKWPNKQNKRFSALNTLTKIL